MERMDAVDHAQAVQERIDRAISSRRRPAPEPPPPGRRDCAECGQPIPPARLRALPSARRCVGCQREAEEAGR